MAPLALMLIFVAGTLTAAPLAADTLAADTLAADTLAADTLAADTLAADTLAADTLAADTLAREFVEGENLPRYRADPDIAALAALPEPLELNTLIRMGLVASGTPAGRRAELEKAILRRIDSAPFREGPPAGLSVEEQARLLLEWMHENLLTRYSRNQTGLDELMASGQYNCVSSAVFYMILLKSRALPVHGVLTRDHAFCRIPSFRDNARGLDVETTTPYGVDPGKRQKAMEHFTGRTGFTYTPPGNYSVRRDIGEKALVSLIYTNRIAGSQREGQWTAAVGLARDAWALLGTEEGRDTFIDALMNCAALMNRQSRHLDALRFLNLAADETGPEEQLDATAAVLLENAVSVLLNGRKPDEALRVLEDEKLCRLVDEGKRRELLRIVESRRLDLLVDRGPFDTALEALVHARELEAVPLERWNTLSAALWNKRLKSIAGREGWGAAWDFLLQAPPLFQAIPQWESIRGYVHDNAVADSHNGFVDAVKRQEWQRAAECLREGLERHPGASVLLKDKKLLEEISR